MLSNSLEDRGFPGGSVVKTLPANAGDTGSIPGPGRSHVPQLFSPCSRTWARNKRSQCGKKPALQLESSPSSLPLEKSLCSHEDPAQPKNNKLNK